MARKSDATQSAIVAALRGVGATVLDTHAIGVRGCPDLCVYWRGRVFWLECKSPGGRISPAQRQFLEAWAGVAHVVYSPQEALTTIGALEANSGGTTPMQG